MTGSIDHSASGSPRKGDFFWDRFRDNTMGRYQFRREYAFIHGSRDILPPPRRVLDIASGSGRIALPLRAAGYDVVATDLERTAMAAFQRHSATLPFVLTDAQRLPFLNSSFDMIVAIQCFEFLVHGQFLQECRRVLRSGGMLVFDAINRHSYKWLIKGQMGRALHLPSANLSWPELERALTGASFDIQRVRGYNWVPFIRESDSGLVWATAFLEEMLRLDRFPAISPKILVAARKHGA